MQVREGGIGSKRMKFQGEKLESRRQLRSGCSLKGTLGKRRGKQVRLVVRNEIFLQVKFKGSNFDVIRNDIFEVVP